MADTHTFLFTPNRWLGQGQITLSESPEILSFQTKWVVSPHDTSRGIACLQHIQIQGLSESMHNQWFIFDHHGEHFAIEFENASLGKILGKGVITDHMIAWELKAVDSGFEGLETYERKDDLSYALYAEYATLDHLRTIIQGTLWLDTTPS